MQVPKLIITPGFLKIPHGNLDILEFDGSQTLMQKSMRDLLVRQQNIDIGSDKTVIGQGDFAETVYLQCLQTGDITRLKIN